MTDWTYELADLLTDVTLAELPLDVNTFQSKLKGWGTCTASLSLGIDDVRQLDLRSLLAGGQRVLYIRRDSQIVWAGILWRGTRTRSQHTMQLQFAELESYFSRRLWTVDYAPFATDQLDIARALISQAAPVLSLQVDQSKSGVLRDKPTEYVGTNLSIVDSLLTDLADSENGFDYAITTVEDGDGHRSRILRFGYPRLGRTAAESGLVFDASIVDWTDDFDALASVTAQYEHGGTVGEGSLSKPLLAVARDELALAGGVPLLEAVSQEHSTVVDQAALEAYARADLAAARVPVTTYQAVVRADGRTAADPTRLAGEPVLGSYVCGDEAMFVLSGDDLYRDDPDGAPGLAVALRILDFTPDVKAGTVTLTLGPAYDGSR